MIVIMHERWVVGIQYQRKELGWSLPELMGKLGIKGIKVLQVDIDTVVANIVMAAQLVTASVTRKGAVSIDRPGRTTPKRPQPSSKTQNSEV